MRRRSLAFAATAGLVLVAAPERGASSGLPAAKPTPTAAATDAEAPETGLAWSPPAGWHPVGPRLTALASPVQQLAAATFDLRQSRPDRDCGPQTARAQLPAHGRW